jgi:hypothetical protein
LKRGEGLLLRDLPPRLGHLLQNLAVALGLGLLGETIAFLGKFEELL